MAKRKSFSSLPKRAKKAAFANMQKDGKLGAKHPVTGKRLVVTKAQSAKRKANLVKMAGSGVNAASVLLKSLR